jgi:acyl-CoA thioester hydrolase
VRSEPPSKAVFSFWTNLGTRNRDTDQFGHVNHAAMASLFEESRIALVFGSHMQEQTSALDLLIAQLTMNFHKELRAPGAIRVGARVASIGKSSLRIEQAIFAGDTCYASALAVCVLVTKSERKPEPISAPIRRSFAVATSDVAHQ